MSDVRWQAFASTVELVDGEREVVQRALGEPFTAPDKWAAIAAARRRWGGEVRGELSVVSLLELEAMRSEPRRGPVP